MLSGACMCGKARYRIDGAPRFMYACGSPIYSHGEATKHVVSVRSGTLKQDPGLRVAYHAFVASKAPWVEIKDGAPQFSEWPDPALIKILWETK